MEIFPPEFRKLVREYAFLRDKFQSIMGDVEISPAFRRHCVYRYIQDLELMMAAKQKTQTPDRSAEEKADFRGFINVTLTDAHKQAIKAWDLESADMFDWMAGAITGGLKVSFSYNKQNDTVSASVMCVWKKSANGGLVVNAYGKDVYSAFRALIYKIDHVLPPKWSDWEDTADDVG